MKSLLISLAILGIVITLAVKRYLGSDAPQTKPPTTRFLNRCLELASEQPEPKAYCTCLWENGVNAMGQLLTSPKGRATAAQCRTAVADDDAE